MLNWILYWTEKLDQCDPCLAAWLLHSELTEAESVLFTPYKK